MTVPGPIKVPQHIASVASRTVDIALRAGNFTAAHSAIDKAMADAKHNPDGYNIGINIGKWAGQSIPHLHIHVIPRYQGDVENPKGGVRGVIPQNKLYTFEAD